MQLADLNVLLYAVNRRDRHHEAARTWLDAALSGAQTVGFAWVVVLGFLRLATLQGVFPSPLSVEQALDVAEQWLASPAAVTVEPTPRHLGVLANLLQSSGTGGNLTTDAHLAALAVEHRASVVTFDRDFGRFDGVRVIEPGAV